MKKEIIYKKSYKNKKFCVTYHGIVWRDVAPEAAAVFAVKPNICNNGIYSGIGEFEIFVVLSCVGLEAGVTYDPDWGLTQKQIKQLAESVLTELG